MLDIKYCKTGLNVSIHMSNGIYLKFKKSQPIW